MPLKQHTLAKLTGQSCKSTPYLRFDEEGWATIRKSPSLHTRSDHATLPTVQDKGNKPGQRLSTEVVSCLFVVIVHLNDVWFVSFRPRTGRRGGRAEREVSKDKLTYPLDEEGDNLNSYGEEKREYIQRAAGSLDAGNFSQRRKEPGESQRRQRGSKIGAMEKMKALLRVGVSLYPLPGTERVRDIEKAQAKERERLRVRVSEVHWIQRTGCWSAPPPLRFTLRRSWRKQEDVRVTSGVM